MVVFARWLAASVHMVISQLLLASKKPNRNKMACWRSNRFVKEDFGWLVIQLVWYILQQLLSYLSVGESGSECFPPLK